MKKCIVIGGGAAGMLAAYQAAKGGQKVLLLEKNEKLGKKIYITGKGRCNITNMTDVESLLKNTVSNTKFLYSSFYSFDSEQLVAFLEEYGCATKVERGNRVFPVSDKASDVIFALQRAMKDVGVEVKLQTKVKSLLVSNEQIEGVELADGSKIQASKVIVCTGGKSYPTTGSDGDGFRFAESLGIKVVNPRPALVPFLCKETWCKDLMGLALKNVSVTIGKGKKVLFQDFGEMLFTHFGISGPLILSASSLYSKKNSQEEMELFIDLKPALSVEQLDKRVLRDFEENQNKQFKNAIAGLFPQRLLPVMIKLSQIDPDKKVNEISKVERLSFVNLIKNLPLTIVGTRGFEEAIITQGGISVKEINPSTMESKKVKGLFFAGEVIDVDAFTGGFNLQIAWSTGYLAGQQEYN